MSPSDALTQAYRRQLQSLTLQRARVGALLGMFLIPAGWGFDLLTRPDIAPAFLGFRLAFSAGVALLWGASFLKAAGRHALALSYAVTLWISIGIELLVVQAGPPATSYASGLSVVMVVTGLLFPWTFRQMLGVAGAIWAIYLVPLGWYPPDPEDPTFLQHLYYMGNTTLVAFCASYFTGKVRWQEFSSRWMLEGRTDELKEARDELSESLEKLKELDRLKTQFFANVSHELRTPLTVMLAVLEGLREGAHSSETDRSLSVLDGNATSLHELINHLLDFAKLDAGKLPLRAERVDLSELLKALAQRFSGMALRRRQQLLVELELGPAILADPHKLETVFRNLLSNALKFTPDGGTVILHGRREAGRCVVEISDTGIGICAEHYRTIFERFGQVDSAQAGRLKGSGIGLSLVKELVELHGGQVEVRSEFGHGSTFTVALPLEAAPQQGPTRATPSSVMEPLPALATPPRPVQTPSPRESPLASGAEASQPLVLVVEDNPDLRHFLSGYLSREFRVVAAVDGDEGLSLAEELHPDLVLTDLMMPGRTGHELAQALKASPRTRAIPVILLTAKGGTEAAVEGLSLGADDFVSKPFSARELLARIRAQLRIRELSRQLADSQKLAMLGTLATGLAHEVRNPINAIINAVPVLQAGLNLASPDAALSREMLELVDESGRRISSLVDDLLGFGRRGSGHPDRWAPSLGIEASLNILGHRAKRVQVHREFFFDGSVQAFPDRMNQAVMNLLDNAFRAVGHQGQVWVRTELKEGGVQVSVRDDGPGIDQDVLPRVFDPFFTTREAGQGTGLGLHLSRQIAEAHRGTLDVQSVPGQGAVFTLWIPDYTQGDPRPRRTGL